MSDVNAPATIADVAKKAGVSTATVSRVINQNAPVAAATATRVWAAIDALNYHPSAAARGLASRKTGVIGLLADDISAPFFVPILRGIETAARAAGYGLLINATPGVVDDGPGFRRPMGPHNTDGMLVFAASLDDAELADLHGRGFPLVLLHRAPPPGLDIPYVTFENKPGARALVDHLIEVHGYRRIAFLRGPENHEDSYWRELGYRASLDAHDIPFDPALVATGGFSQTQGRDAIRRWLHKGVVMDAIFAGDDDAATGAIMAIQEAGKRVPEDIAVVGFDDVHLSHPWMPPLTTVRAPVEEAGREAARQLMRLIQTGEANPQIRLATELIIRRSCGCPYERP
jgi:DNA-binding LacI/PurR family transcriptional regulator